MELGEVKDLVILRLSFFNITDIKDNQLDYLIFKALNSINNITNQVYTAKTFPSSILEIWVDKAVGEYIKLLKTTNSLPSDYDLSLVATQIKEGDTTISFGSSTESEDAQNLNSAIFYLMNGRNSELVRYRRLAPWK